MRPLALLRTAGHAGFGGQPELAARAGRTSAAHARPWPGIPLPMRAVHHHQQAGNEPVTAQVASLLSCDSTTSACTLVPGMLPRAGKPGGYYGPWYSSSGLAVNVGNTAELEPASKEAQDPEARWGGHLLLP